MTIELTTEEKTAIIDSHIKNCKYNQYNVRVSIVEENAKVSPDQKAIDNLNQQLTDSNNQIAALQKEITDLVSSNTNTPSN